MIDFEKEGKFADLFFDPRETIVWHVLVLHLRRERVRKEKQQNPFSIDYGVTNASGSGGNKL